MRLFIINQQIKNDIHNTLEHEMLYF